MLLFIALFSVAVFGQGIGYNQAETHPKLSFSKCTKSGCTKSQKSAVIDANWRWVHNSQSQNCYTGNEWDSTICSDPVTCAKNCQVDGADYRGTYGVTSDGDTLKLNFVTFAYGKNVGSRLYMLDGDDKYLTFSLLNQEFTFDVDVSQLPCGLNGALYFVEMDADGGKAKYPNNKAGARYGTGYCDAQCPHDIKFINGEGNILDWNPNPSDPNSGQGKYGTCCVEMDIWESNSISSAFTLHPCDADIVGQTRCEGVDCGDNPDHRYDGVCDKDGCDFNTYRLGDKLFFGPGAHYTVDTTRKFTVVTQFITEDGTADSDLKEVKRLFVQDGRVIEIPKEKVGDDQTGFNSISDDFCKAAKTEMGDNDSFGDKGGMKSMSDAFKRNSMVLVMSLWDDHAANMLWLDSCYPTSAPTEQPGVCRGTCSTDSGDPSDVENNHPNAYVSYGNIKVGDIGTTYPSGPVTTPAPGDCPGGNLAACIGLCPSSPASAYQACVQECIKRCPSETHDAREFQTRNTKL